MLQFDIQAMCACKGTKIKRVIAQNGQKIHAGVFKVPIEREYGET